MSSYSTKEIWKDIPGYERSYQVSNLGRIRSLTRNRPGKSGSSVPHYGRIRNPQTEKTGYKRIALCKNAKVKVRFVHCLVLEAFVGPCPPGMECRHYPDRNRGNCRLNNLQWDTRVNNHHDKIEHGTSQRGEKQANVKLTEKKVLEIRHLREKGHTIPKLSRMFGVAINNIWCIIHRITWKHI